MTNNIVYIIGPEKFDRLELPSPQKTIKHGGHTYNLLLHKKLTHRRFRGLRNVWIFRLGRSNPLDIEEMAATQKYKKITPSALKIVVSQNIEHTFFKSLLERRGFAGIGRRKMIILFVVVAVAVIALKAMGYY